VRTCSSPVPMGSYRCVDRGWPSTRQTLRSDTPKVSLTCSAHRRRRVGLRSFPQLPPSGSGYLQSSRRSLSSDECAGSIVKVGVGIKMGVGTTVSATDIDVGVSTRVAVGTGDGGLGPSSKRRSGRIQRSPGRRRDQVDLLRFHLH